MAGMLPGVECARRRRMHRAGGPAVDSAMGSRRSSFCLYAAGHEPHHSLQRCHLYKMPSSGQSGAELSHTAREAKERLDGRLGIQRASIDSRREISVGTVADYGTGSNRAAAAGLQRQVFCSGRKNKDRNGILRFGWIRAAGLLWWTPKKDANSTVEEGNDEDGEEVECAVCLGSFKDGDELVGLRCSHRFHRECALPWLRSSGRCPCCRSDVFS